jgi:hypothetical protein
MSTWLRTRDREPDILYRVKLPADAGFVTVAVVEKAVAEATSWVKRNCREWPHEYCLQYRYNSAVTHLEFYWQRDS